MLILSDFLMASASTSDHQPMPRHATLMGLISIRLDSLRNIALSHPAVLARARGHRLARTVILGFAYAPTRFQSLLFGGRCRRRVSGTAMRRCQFARIG